MERDSESERASPDVSEWLPRFPRLSVFFFFDARDNVSDPLVEAPVDGRAWHIRSSDATFGGVLSLCPLCYSATLDLISLLALSRERLFFWNVVDVDAFMPNRVLHFLESVIVNAGGFLELPFVESSSIFYDLIPDGGIWITANDQLLHQILLPHDGGAMRECSKHCETEQRWMKQLDKA